MSEVLCAERDEHPFCCGVFEVGNFYYGQLGGEYDIKLSDHFPTLTQGGTGLFTATFIDSPPCREAYKKLTDKFTLLFQSEPRLNRNSQRDVFLCVFQGRN